MTNTQITILFIASIILVLTCVIALVSFLYANVKERKTYEDSSKKLLELRQDIKTADYFREQQVYTEAQYQEELARINHEVELIANKINYFTVDGGDNNGKE